MPRLSPPKSSPFARNPRKRRDVNSTKFPKAERHSWVSTSLVPATDSMTNADPRRKTSRVPCSVISVSCQGTSPLLLIFVADAGWSSVFGGRKKREGSSRFDS